jgi:ribosomal protein S18 acetylase RimI-like enzyme
MAEHAVRAATSEREQAVVDVLTLAFAQDPMARWALPDAHVYLKAWPLAVRAFGRRALLSGSADVLEDGGGAALWLPPGVEPDTERLVGLIREHSPAPRLPALMEIFEQMGQFHPKEPHWYLPLIGVDPARQGMGLGSILLRHAVARSDREGVLAYLESSNPRNISLYERHGFVRLGIIQSGQSPEVVPMLRRAQ